MGDHVATGPIPLIKIRCSASCKALAFPSAAWCIEHVIGACRRNSLSADGTASDVLWNLTCAQQPAGWTDPLIQQNVSMGFAWPAADSASALVGVPTPQLTYEDSPLVFQYSLQTGKVAGTQAYSVSCAVWNLPPSTAVLPITAFKHSKPFSGLVHVQIWEVNI